jgi:proteasome assembly chaperone (PAC2) family protein
MTLGNYEVTEKCLQINKQFDKLNFFYASTGSLSKLKKMQIVAQTINDPNLRFNSATLIADPAEKVKVLAETGQIPLAYLTARSHGLEQFTKTLEKTIRESEEYDHERIFQEAEKYIGTKSQRSKALLPLRPVFVGDESLN